MAPGEVRYSKRSVRPSGRGSAFRLPPGQHTSSWTRSTQQESPCSSDQSAPPTFFDWDCLEGVVGYMKGRDWVAVGANRVLAGNPDTLDGYLKQHVPRQTANYIAVLLAQAGVLDLDDAPARVRLSAEWSTT
jgi:hypothetical protein